MKLDFSAFTNITITDVDFEELDEGQQETLYQYARYWHAINTPNRPGWKEF